MYLVIGASGFVGPYILKNILQKTTDPIIATYNSRKPDLDDARISWHKLNIENVTELENFCHDLRKKNQPLKVIYLSAISSPDYVENNPQSSWNLNIVALNNFLKHLPKPHIFYFASSDSVYGESLLDHAFCEEDKPNPVNEYGRQKAEGEKTVLALGYNVVRYPLMIGKSMSGKKHLFDVIIENLSSGQEIEMFNDSYRNALSFTQAADFTVNLIEKYQNKNIGAVNICSDQAISRYDLALIIAKKCNLDEKLIKSVSSDSTKVFSAKRAKKTLLDNSKLKYLLHMDKIVIEI